MEQVARTNRYVGGNEYFTINFARFHCSNCEHFRPAGAKPQGVTINYDGVMPQSIYYAAHRMPPSNDTYVFARRRALCRRPSASLRFRCMTRGNPLPPPLLRSRCGGWSARARRNSLADACRKPPLSATCAFRIRRCVHLDKLAALNLTSFISSNLPRSTARVPTASREMFYTCAKPYPAYVSRYIVIGYNT